MILFIDDESRLIDSYIQELELSGYQVELKNNVDSAIQFIKENCHIIKLVILDIMMSPGKLLEDVDTDDGLRTGVCFHKKIRNDFPELPIIMFTNFSNKELENQINQDKQSKFLQKVDYLPFELVNEIKIFLVDE